MTLVAGVDSSTQSCKVVVLDADTGAIVREGRAPHPDGTSVDPTAWWDALLAAIADAGGLDDVAAISVAGQQHGMVALDAEGRVVRDALLWNDTRSADAAAALTAEVGAEEYARRTNVVPVASFTATKLRWLRDHEPESAARVAAVCLPHDWLTWRLRGFGPVDAGQPDANPLGPDLDALTTDRSDASGTAYWSPTTGQYDLELLERALGRVVRVPRVLEPTASPGVTGAAEVPTGIRLGAGAGDNAAAALGLGAGSGDVVISIGTSGTVFAVSSEAVRDASGTVAGFASADGEHLPLVATLNAARVLDVTAALLGVDHDGLAELALAAEPGAGGLVLLPYFEGERTPNLPDATAALGGMTLAATTRANLARASIEGMLCGLADGLDAIVRQGLRPRRLLLVGGAARSRAVPGIASAVLGLPVVVPEAGEYVARGAARQAAGVLAGAMPDWPLTVHASVEHPPAPHVRAAYAAEAARRSWA